MSRTRMWFAGLALAMTSCVSIGFERTNRFEPPAARALDTLAVGDSDLSACLDALGAPLWVAEWPGFEGQGAVLTYGWFEEGEWDFDASIPVGDGSGALTFKDVDSRMRGVVLFFESDWILAELRAGFLRELGSTNPRGRPQPLEEDMQEAAPRS